MVIWKTSIIYAIIKDMEPKNIWRALKIMVLHNGIDVHLVFVKTMHRVYGIYRYYSSY